MDPKNPAEEADLESWSPESGDSPERARRADGELSFEEQKGRSACDGVDDTEPTTKGDKP